jgi:hypothetical protein
VWWISVEDRDPWCLVGDDAIHLLPQLPGGGGVGRLRRLRLAGELVDVRIAEPGEVAGVGGVLVNERQVRSGRKKSGALGTSVPQSSPPIWILLWKLPAIRKNRPADTVRRFARYPSCLSSWTR